MNPLFRLRWWLARKIAPRGVRALKVVDDPWGHTQAQDPNEPRCFEHGAPVVYAETTPEGDWLVFECGCRDRIGVAPLTRGAALPSRPSPGVEPRLCPTHGRPLESSSHVTHSSDPRDLGDWLNFACGCRHRP